MGDSPSKASGASIEYMYGPDSPMESGQIHYYEGDVFAGIPGDVLAQSVSDTAAVKRLDHWQAVTELTDIRRIFLGSTGQIISPNGTIGRSVLVANPHEKALLAQGQALGHRLRDSIFPSGKAQPQAEARYNLLQRPDIKVVSMDTAWPRLALVNWLERAIEPDPNAGNIGIMGLGQIGSQMSYSLMAMSAVMPNSPIRNINILNDPSSQFGGRILENQHILNPNDVGINVFADEDIDAFLGRSAIIFCIFSHGIPPLQIKDPSQGDVRMQQFGPNHDLLRKLTAQAEAAGFKGTIVVVSDPPEHLATAIVRENATRVALGTYGKKGVILGNHQVVAEAGITNLARAEAVFREQYPDQLARFRREGFVFGPHGRGSVVINSTTVEGFDPRLSRAIGSEVAVANYKVRKAGKLPADAPGVNQALAVLKMLQGEQMPVSLALGRSVTGVRAKFHPDVGAFETDVFPDAHPDVVHMVRNAGNYIRSTQAIAAGEKVETAIPSRTTAFWSHGVVTGETVPLRLRPHCTGRNISNFNAMVMANHHFPFDQGAFYIPRDVDHLAEIIRGIMAYLPLSQHQVKEMESNGTAAAPKGTYKDNVEPVYQEIETGVGVLHVELQRMARGRKTSLAHYRATASLFLQVDVDVDKPDNADFIKMLVNDGAICLGFTPRTHAAAPKLHFGFIGDHVTIDGEFPDTPLLSSMVGFDSAIQVFRNLKRTIEEIRKKTKSDDPDEERALTHREKVMENYRGKLSRDDILLESLVQVGLYDESPTLYEHLHNVDETLISLMSVLGIKDVDKIMARRIAALHDLGKAVYLQLMHYVNAYKLQQKNLGPDGQPRALTETELGNNSQHWRYGKHLECLRSGQNVVMPPKLLPFAEFVDLESGKITRDVEIGKRIIEMSPKLQDQKELSKRLKTFFDADELLIGCDNFTILVELADNLSDYGRLSTIEDIIRFLEYKEHYVLQRYGHDDGTTDKIKRKFDRLKQYTADFARVSSD